MIWLTWRQYRVEFLAALGALLVVSAYAAYSGYTIREAFNSDVLGCVAADGCDPGAAQRTFVERHKDAVTILSLLLLAVPTLFGLFWGAPLVGRELETHTHRLVWNQSITRVHWLAVKLAVVGAAAAVATGAFSLLLTWAASRHDQVKNDRFFALTFASRNIVPVGYVLFALLLGAVVGILVRRTIAAMAITLVLVVLLQALLPMAIRPYLRPPVTETVMLTEATIEQGGGSVVPSDEGLASITGYTVPGALMVTSSATLLDASGNGVPNAVIRDCMTQRPGGARGNPLIACLAERDLRFEVSYHPSQRYWWFQWMELLGYLVLTALLAGVGFWRIRRVTG
jgi:hypothetical protein